MYRNPKKIRGLLMALAALFLGSGVFSQDCKYRISLLTASPGDELYSSFGHSALRVFDSTNNHDLVFNYGTFNFDEPNFYMKFVRGKPKYFISVDDFQSFMYDYQVENRSITEQVLNLTCEEKEAVRAYLQWNLLPANRFYKYDFTFDNCTTRLGLLLDSITANQVRYKAALAGDVTFRDAIDEYLDRTQKSWSKLGIDILLGSRLDKKMTAKQAMFLPDNLMKGLDSANLNGKPVVADKEIILKRHYVPTAGDNVSGPLFIFSCLFVIIAFLSFSPNKRIKRFLSSLDGAFFFLNGMAGILLIFMWIGTDHYMTKDNFNLMWAWPLNIIAAFYLRSSANWIGVYLRVFALALLALLVSWFFLPQRLNFALIPIICIFIFRSFKMSPVKQRLYAGNHR